MLRLNKIKKKIQPDCLKKQTKNLVKKITKGDFQIF